MRERVAAIDVKSAAVDAFEETEPTYIAYNLDQMLHGIDSLGDTIGVYQSEKYAEKKYALNPLAGFGIIDLRLEGSFYGGATAKVRGDLIVISSTDEKDPKLEAAYGKSIWGLTDDNKRKYVQGEFGNAFREKVAL